MTAELDQQLVGDIAAGSADALGRLYDRYAATVFALARRILMRVEDAEEVVQDVFAQVWREAARYRGDRASVAGWMAMLARTRAIDRLRSRKARPDVDRAVEPTPDVGPSPGRNPEDLAVSAEDVRQVRRALGELPDAQRALIELACYEGLTHSEIAERTGTPLGTVKTRIRAAMASLRGALAPETDRA